MTASRLVLRALINAGGGPLPRKDFDLTYLGISAISSGIRSLKAIGAVVQFSERYGQTPGLLLVTDMGLGLNSGELIIRAQRKIKGCKSPNIAVPSDSNIATYFSPKLSGWDRIVAKRRSV